MTGTAERRCATALSYTLYAYCMCLSTRVGKHANITMARSFTMSVRRMGRGDHLSLSGERLSTNLWLLNIASLTVPLRCSPSRSRSGGSFFHAAAQSPTPRLLHAPRPAQCPQRPEFRTAARELQACRKDTKHFAEEFVDAENRHMADALEPIQLVLGELLPLKANSVTYLRTRSYADPFESRPGGSCGSVSGLLAASVGSRCTCTWRSATCARGFRLMAGRVRQESPPALDRD
jgi:hypothetical protein